MEPDAAEQRFSEFASDNLDLVRGDAGGVIHYAYVSAYRAGLAASPSEEVLKYIGHRVMCPSAVGGDACTCGLTAALAALRTTKGKK